MNKYGKCILALLLIAAPFFTKGQQCSCEKKFQFIKHEIETNYAGYKDKVNPKTKKEYDDLTRKTLAKVRKSANDAYCLYALYDWTKFFKDGHVQLFDPREPNMNDTAAIAERIKKCEVIHLSPERLKQLENSTDHEEGIYYYGDFSYKIAVIKSKNEFRDYAGVIISSKYPMWQEGQVKLELRKNNDSLYNAVLYMRDHSFRPQLYYFNGASFDGGNWNKVGKQQKAYNSAVSSKFHFEKVQAQKLSDSTLYIQIGTFSISNKRAIDSVFKANENSLKTMPYLVLDLRRNGGGGDEAYESIMPYIYTNPIIGYGNDIFATRDNIARRRKYLETEKDMSQENKDFYLRVINRMEQNIGKFAVHARNDTTRYDAIEQYPRKVVVLIEHHCASTTEEFLLAAKQSKKVILMGEHTYGELDYSNWLIAESPCNDIEFHYSSTKSSRIALGKGIDGIGIQPDIKLSFDQDWIQEAQKYLEK